MTPARGGAACDEVGLTREDENVSAYEEERNRNIVRNRDLLRELGLEPLSADSQPVTPQKRQRIVYERTRASSRVQPWMTDGSYREDGGSQRQRSRPSSLPAPAARACGTRRPESPEHSGCGGGGGGGGSGRGGSARA